jgi:hypothetical protein
MIPLTSNSVGISRQFDGMHIAGYTISVSTKEGVVEYGLFPTKEAADEWGKNFEYPLRIATIYQAVWNRG